MLSQFQINILIGSLLQLGIIELSWEHWPVLGVESNSLVFHNRYCPSYQLVIKFMVIGAYVIAC